MVRPHYNTASLCDTPEQWPADASIQNAAPPSQPAAVALGDTDTLAACIPNSEWAVNSPNKRQLVQALPPGTVSSHPTLPSNGLRAASLGLSLPPIVVKSAEASAWGSALPTPASETLLQAASIISPGHSLQGPLSCISIHEQARISYEVAYQARLDRHRFLQKVYALLSAQLLLVALLAHQLIHVKALRHFMHRAPWALALPSVLLALLIIISACSTAIRAASPVNLVNLGLLTAALGLQLAAAAAAFHTKALMLATLMIAATLLVLCLHALQTVSDASYADSSIWTAATLLLLVVAARHHLQVPVVTALVAGCAALCVVAAVSFDAHLMAAGDHVHQQHRYTAAVFAVLNLYTDAITLTLCMLQQWQESCADRHAMPW